MLHDKASIKYLILSKDPTSELAAFEQSMFYLICDPGNPRYLPTRLKKQETRRSVTILLSIREFIAPDILYAVHCAHVCLFQ